MKYMKCACGSIARYKKHLKFNGIDVGGWACEKCKEVYYPPEKIEKILLLNQLKKMQFELKLSEVKSNLILRIPKKVSSALDLHKGDKIGLRLKEVNEIVINPLNYIKK